MPTLYDWECDQGHPLLLRSILAMFRQGRDTCDIAKWYNTSEAKAARLLHMARIAEKDKRTK